MRRSCLFTMAALLFSGVAFTACSSEDELTDVANVAADVQTLSVSIPATRGTDADTRTLVWGDGSLATVWATTDQIFVVKGSGESAVIDANTLSPDQAGSSANLVGELAESYEVGDELTLVIGFWKSGSFLYRWLNYTSSRDVVGNQTINQRGTKASVGYFDYASATVEVTAVDGGKITTTPASFVPCQSIYRFSFTDGTDPIKASNVKIREANKLVSTYDIIYKKEDTLGEFPLKLYLDTPASEIYVALRVNENTEGDVEFEVEDENGKIYKGTKTFTGSEPVNGKYYAATVTLTATGEQNTFKISPADSYTLYGNGVYSITGDATISGTNLNFDDHQIQLDTGVSIIFDNVTLLNGGEYIEFLSDRGVDQTITLTGENKLDGLFSIYRVQNLTFKGSGSLTGFKVYDRDLELFKNGTMDYELDGTIVTGSVKYEDGLKFIENGDGTYSIKKSE